MASIAATQRGGSPVNISSLAQPDGSQAIVHVLTDGSLNPYSATNPLLTAPAISTADFVPGRSGTITATGVVILDIPANASRRGGQIRASLQNQGIILVTLIKSGATQLFTLDPGAVFSMTIQPGLVLPHEITIAGTFIGDTFEGAEFI